VQRACPMEVSDQDAPAAVGGLHHAPVELERLAAAL
jgi:hypothetical protein